ncbi:GNAT family N-acetyltransferase [Hoeflea sp.]|uniref:GNAT family N-acetyltransferase n=1 Tax=Hoeflea sp. TaxID=1940281 RepID=UPI003B51E32B
MPSTPTIRPAQADDRDWIVEAHGDLYAREFGFGPAFRAGIAEKMKAILALDDAFTRLWIAETGGVRAGSAAIWRQAADTAFLNFVLVYPAFRGQGLAETLMARAIEHARDHDLGQLRLETYSCLAAARRLYARKGFALTEVEPDIAKFGQVFDREFWTLRL